MLTVTFQSSNLTGIHEQIHAFLGASVPKTMPVKLVPRKDEDRQMELPLPKEGNGIKPFAIEVPGTEPEPPKKAKGGRKKAKPADDVFETKPIHNAPPEEESADNESPAIVQHTANKSAPIVNKEAVHQALQQVNINAGLPKAREILSYFKVNRISEIKEEQYKEFIEKCNEATMMA